MSIDKVTLRNIKSISELSIEFDFSETKLLVVTGKNGVGKTSVIKAFHLRNDPEIFKKSAGENATRESSEICFEIDGFDNYRFTASNTEGVLDTRDKLPSKSDVIAELPIPFGKRFEQFAFIASFDEKIKVGIAAAEYKPANELIAFMSQVYDDGEYKKLNEISIGKYTFYFILKPDDYYIREDHLSSGEFYLIQLYRLITSGAKLVLIDEFDVALDAAAQVKLYAAIKPLLDQYQTRLVVISHSLAFMSTVDDGGLYYMEKSGDNTSLEQRSFGYIKSDLYGFKGIDRFIVTEDKLLVSFLSYLIIQKIRTFFSYEIIPVGGQPQIDTICNENDVHKIFGEPDQVLVVVDDDIIDQVKYKGQSKLTTTSIKDIELFIWSNREILLPDVVLAGFKEAKKNKDTAKTYWKKIVNSKQKTEQELFDIVISQNKEGVNRLIQELKKFLCI